MRLSLTLIASFFFFKSFASGNHLVGYVWFNPNAEANACDPVDAGFVDGAVDNALEVAGVTDTGSWAIGSQSYVPDRSLRGDGRELCSQWCINRCRNMPYLCYGVCAGCRRNLQNDDDEETQPDYKTICETAVQGQATNDDISETCRTALVSAKCQINIE
jgi:hypothetical protein